MLSLPVNTHFFGVIKEIRNGKVVEDKTINGEYNGKVLHIDKRDNHKIAHYDIKNDKLKILLAIPKIGLTLFERLNRDYTKSSSKRSSKTQKQKRGIKKRSIKKRSRKR